MSAMDLRLLAALGVIALSAALPVACQTSPVLHGLVTHIGTPAEFTVDRSRVSCTQSTTNTLLTGAKRIPLTDCPARFLGEAVTIYGKRDDKSGAVAATKIESETPIAGKVEGFAVIDRIATPLNAAGITISADGYSIDIPVSVHPVFLAPLTNQTQVTTNLWIRYSGTQHPDGSVTAEAVTFSSNSLKDRERKANEKAEFDPASVTDEDRQGGLSKAFRGVDPKRFPATHDAAMQQRIESIGNKLIPAYQRNLPTDDPSKITFRFQVVDRRKLHDALTLSNGIILISQQVVARLENDSQVATVLADNVACAMEKQELRQIPAHRAMKAGDVALIAGGLFVPGLGLAGNISDGVASAKMLKHAEEQSGRVSLVLLYGAGYDLAEAPKAWWILGSPERKSSMETSIPYRARYLYRLLATTWRTPTATSKDFAAIR